MSINSNLNKAKILKNDEFYTQISDIAREMEFYKEHFKGKIVFCNCDDARTSEFFSYFSYNFERLGLKKLVAMSNTDILTKESTYIETKNNNYIPDDTEVFISTVVGKGDFRSTESIKLLIEADIVVTNPPFSLFKAYIAQLVKYDKKFLILGNINAVIYTGVFPLIRDDKLWISNPKKVLEFKIPDHYKLSSSSGRIDGTQKYVKLPFVKWFTNLNKKNKCEDLQLYKKYTSEEYPKYDNYDAINVDKVKDIPVDYFKPMGVPITFLCKYAPNPGNLLKFNIQDGLNNPVLLTRSIYKRLIIQRK